VADSAFTVPVTVTDLRVGDVIKWSDGRYYVVDTAPETGAWSGEYSEPKVAVFVTEMNVALYRMGDSASQVHAPEAVLNVLMPRPTE